MAEFTSIIYVDDSKIDNHLKLLIDALNLEVIHSKPQQGLSFHLKDNHLYFVLMQEKLKMNLELGFQTSSLLHRFKKGISKKELFAKAIGVGKVKTVLDMTGGLGVDSLMCAALGLKVICVEQSKVLFQILKWAQDSVEKSSPMRKIVERIDFIHGDSIDVFKEIKNKNSKIDVLYLDPMFPEKKKSALSPKEMQILQGLHDAPSEERNNNFLLQTLKYANCRVVVKRPAKSDYLVKKTDHSFMGKSVRYDLYLP